jgi:hypothetical protein
MFHVLIGILSMEFQVAGKKVEIDYMSQQRKESSRLLSQVSLSNFLSFLGGFESVALEREQESGVC